MTFHYLCFLCVMSLLQEPFMVQHISTSPNALWPIKLVSCELKTRRSYSSAIQNICGSVLIKLHCLIGRTYGKIFTSCITQPRLYQYLYIAYVCVTQSHSQGSQFTNKLSFFEKMIKLLILNILLYLSLLWLSRACMHEFSHINGAIK